MHEFFACFQQPHQVQPTVRSKDEDTCECQNNQLPKYKVTNTIAEEKVSYKYLSKRKSNCAKIKFHSSAIRKSQAKK